MASRTVNTHEVAGEKASVRPIEGAFEEAILAQATALHGRMPGLCARYEGKVVAFYDGEVICSGDTDEEVIERIPEEKRNLPFVIATVCRESEAPIMSKPLSDHEPALTQDGTSQAHPETGQPLRYSPEAVLVQARMLDEQMETMRLRFAGKVIVFCDGQVLCSAATEEEAISLIPKDMWDLPFVIRPIEAVSKPDYMGGPKGTRD